MMNHALGVALLILALTGCGSPAPATPKKVPAGASEPEKKTTEGSEKKETSAKRYEGS
jgi:hypothetical protein